MLFGFLDNYYHGIILKNAVIYDNAVYDDDSPVEITVDSATPDTANKVTPRNYFPETWLWDNGITR